MSKIFYLPDTEKVNRGCESLAKIGYKPTVVNLMELVDENDLMDDADLASYHQKQWDNAQPKDFKLDSEKANNWTMSEVPYAVQRKDGSIVLADGRHRCRAAINAGYDAMEIMLLKESDHPEIFENDINEEVEYHDMLNPKLWNDDNELIPEVKEKILDIVSFFIDKLEENGIDIKVSDIYLLGSNANYNYNDDSDIDIHIIADESFDCSEKHLDIIYQVYKSLFNSKYDIKIKDINVELYVENKDNQTNVATGVYSLNHGWIKNPNKMEKPEINQEAVDKGLKTWKSKYDELVINPTLDSINAYIDGIYDLRTNSIKSEGEFGVGNLIFKEVRRLGILDNLKELKIELENKELSLESLNETWDIKFNEDFSIKEQEYIDEGRLLKNLGKAALIALAAGSSIASLAGIHNKANNETEQLNNLQKQVEVVEQCLETLPDTITIHTADIVDQFRDKTEIMQKNNHKATKTDNGDGTVTYKVFNDLLKGDYIEFTLKENGHLESANTSEVKEIKGDIDFKQDKFNYTVDKETGKYTKALKRSDDPYENQGKDFTSKDLTYNDYKVKDIELTYSTANTEQELTQDLAKLQNASTQLDSTAQQTKTIASIIDSLVASGVVAAGILGATKKKKEN